MLDESVVVKKWNGSAPPADSCLLSCARKKRTTHMKKRQLQLILKISLSQRQLQLCPLSISLSNYETIKQTCMSADCVWMKIQADPRLSLSLAAFKTGRERRNLEREEREQRPLLLMVEKESGSLNFSRTVRKPTLKRQSLRIRERCRQHWL